MDNSEATTLRQELAAAQRAISETETSLARVQHEFNQRQRELLSEMGHWQQACAEYRADAEQLRRWRALRQKIAPDGGLRHLLLGLIKVGAERVLRRRSLESKPEAKGAKLLLQCEQPNLDTGGKLSGFACIRGWAGPRSRVKRIEIIVDDSPAGIAFYGFVRPDIIRSHPETGSGAQVGFSFRLDTKTLSAGMHALKVLLTGVDGETLSSEGKIEVVHQQHTQECLAGQTELRGKHRNESDAHRACDTEPIEASIVIFARNQADFLARSLPIIAQQKASFKFEIIGFDTESTDGTSEVFRRHGARVVPVRKSDFHHVTTRLQSLKQARGKFIIFFVGDAIPADDHWLQALVRPLLSDPLVAAVYSRQIPGPDCVPWEARDIYSGCSVVREVREVDWLNASEVANYRNNQWKFISFSDVSACYRRELLETVPVLSGLPEVEDQYWCKCLLEAGFRIVLEPTSVVIHSHNHSLGHLYERQVRFGRCFATFLEVRPEAIHTFIYGTVVDIINDLLFTVVCGSNWLLKTKWIFQVPVMRFTKRYGLRQGFRFGAFDIQQTHSTKAAANRTNDPFIVQSSR